MRRLVRYKEVGDKYAKHIEVWVDDKGFKEIANRLIKGEITKMKVIKKESDSNLEEIELGEDE